MGKALNILNSIVPNLEGLIIPDTSHQVLEEAVTNLEIYQAL